MGSGQAEAGVGVVSSQKKDMAFSLRPLQPENAEAVLLIYGKGIAKGHDATFEAKVPRVGA